MNDIASSLVGRFIAFDGPDGSGKSTQLALFVNWCEDNGVVVKVVRELASVGLDGVVRLWPATEVLKAPIIGGLFDI